MGTGERIRKKQEDTETKRILQPQANRALTRLGGLCDSVKFGSIEQSCLRLNYAVAKRCRRAKPKEKPAVMTAFIC